VAQVQDLVVSNICCNFGTRFLLRIEGKVEAGGANITAKSGIGALSGEKHSTVIV